MQRHNRMSWIGVVGVIAGLLAGGTAVAGGGPVLSATLPEATVKIALPSDKIDVGLTAPFKVSVAPTSGKPDPVRVRARLGMPDMGHWVTGEQGHSFAPELAFDFKDHLDMGSAIPMYGLYRLRVWLDYADGSQTKTAVDFKVVTDEPLNAVVVE